MLRNAAQAALGGIVCEANTAVIKEPGKHGPSFQHVVHRFCDIVAAGQRPALHEHPTMQVGYERCAEFLPHTSTLLKTTPVDISLDVEQPVDALNRFQAKR
jgi:hypothetical protein